MKNAFGKILFVLVFAACVYAEPGPTPYLNPDGPCGVPQGFIRAHIFGVADVPENYRTYVIVGPHSLGGYAARRNLEYPQSYGSTRVFWYDDNHPWQAQSSSVLSPSQCLVDWENEAFGLVQQYGTDPALYYNHFWPELPDSRLPMDVDLDGNGRLDYCDLDSQSYQDYLQFCAENDLDDSDLADYMYWYQHGLDEYLATRDQYFDSDLDGFSDGYETIHGTDKDDNLSYPLGRPDMGTANQVMGGVDDPQPWRYEEYGDSGWSRGHVYDRGYDPFGDTPIETINEGFEGSADWAALDSDGDGWSNQTEVDQSQNPYDFDFHPQSEYFYNDEGGYWEYAGGVEPGPYPWGDPPTLEEAMEAAENYETGDYAYNPSEFQFGVQEYDEQLDKFGKIKFNVDAVRPQVERDYQINFNIPIPGGNNTVASISARPTGDGPVGGALESFRLLVRAITVVVISYVFIKNVWLVIRQY